MKPFWNTLELARYACVAWAALLIGQQVLKTEAIKSGNSAIADAIASINRSVADGHQPDLGIVRIPRIAKGIATYVVRAENAKTAIAVPSQPVIDQLVATQSIAIEAYLLYAGLAIAGEALFLRSAVILFRAVGAV